MKKSFFLIFIALVACSPKQYIEKSIIGSYSSQYLDFTKYVEKGFVFSTTGINQEFIPLGVINFVFNPDRIEHWAEFKDVYTEYSDTKYTTENGKKYIITYSDPVKINIDSVFDKVYNDALKLGANGIINLTFKENSDKSFELAGTVIKIK